MFSARQFLKDAFVNPTQLIAFAQAYGVTFNPPTVQKWFLRDSVPGDVLAVLLALQEMEQGRPVSVLPYVRAAA